MKPFHKTGERTNNKKQDKKRGRHEYQKDKNKDKDNGNIINQREKSLATYHKKQSYMRRHDNSHHRSSSADFVGET